MLEARGRDVLLVDRQPLQGVRCQAAGEVTAFRPERIFDTAIVDPPWYPQVVRDWLAIAAHGVQPGGTILVSVWPPSTRPSAPGELTTLHADIRTWARIHPAETVLEYDTPQFEQAAGQCPQSGELSRSPRIGTLWTLTVDTLPPWPLPNPFSEIWARFILDDYQIAFRHQPPAAGEPALLTHPNSEGWCWPFVSARAPARERIGVWSSDNEVALLCGSDVTIAAFRQAVHAPDEASFLKILQTIPGLAAWNIPRPPFRRLLEWTNRK
jgi:hypothetical protein